MTNTRRSKCVGHKANGAPCGRYPTKGAVVCRSHGAGAPQVAAKAAVRAELEDWGLDGDVFVDPGETLMRLLAQSRRRVAEYAGRLARAVAAENNENDALIGDTVTVDGEGGEHKTGEYIRGLVQAESEERDRCARFAKLVLDGRIDERRIRIEENDAAMLTDVIRLVFAAPELGLSASQQEAAVIVLDRIALAPA